MASLDMASALHNYLNTCNAAVDTLELLRFVNVDDLKTFAHAQIDKMESDTLRTAYHSSLPINAVLSNDVVQHILSFDDFYAKIKNRVICKQWNRLYKLNEENLLRTVYQSVNDKYPEPLPSDNHTWIWHEARTVLHPIEQRLGYRGSINNFDELHQLCKSGDRVLVHKTIWNDRDLGMFTTSHFNKDVHLIGLYPVEQGHVRCCIPLHEMMKLSGHLTLEHLTVYSSAATVEGPGRLTLKHCNVEGEGAIAVLTDGNLEVEGCTFRARPIWQQSHGLLAMRISPWANKVNICKSTFKAFKRAIEIKRYGRDDGRDGTAEIKITDTVFDDVLDHAVVELTDYRRNQEAKIVGTQQWTLQGNTSSVKSIDPNTLLHIKEDQWEDYEEDFSSLDGRKSVGSID